MDLKDIFSNINAYLDKEIVINGWIKNHRRQKEFGFIDFYDGTCFTNLQVVYDIKIDNFKGIQKMLVGSAIKIKGILVASNGNQAYELQAKELILLGACPEDYPIQPKRHTNEFLRSVAYLRPRTNLYNAIFRVRSLASLAIHEYFNKNNYVYVHTPLITGADCEGSNQMFKLTTLDLNKIPLSEGQVDYKQDLFNKETFITGSGQLHGETFALAYKKIYTFGPTFRTERSNTKIHANEFWMIEPEIAFCDLEGLMVIEEDMLKYVVSYILDKCSDEINFFDKYVNPGLKQKLEKLISSTFSKITHHEAVDLLIKADKQWEYTPSYEEDIAKEHEKYLTDYFNGPVFVTNWPKDIKAWYMKLNSDEKTVAAVDLIVPEAGELMGGSQREDDYNILIKRMKELKVDQSSIDWYLNLRKYGGCVHSGFGMGFERLIIYLTGADNIRDVIPFPRTPGNCDY